MLAQLEPKLVATNKYIHESVLFVIGAFLHLCDWYSNGNFPY